ncbi:hypothetical protein HHI36_009964 [Cryptolaemus montrouzieri]|uniref:Glucose-methanol-choline oxidoreductase N-terminal domain-containing protein n=1 Tax=Cryptolaemus montrouzieri TaxID=559131 RepID=A0ABD2MHD8_9CUCU
MIFVFFILLCFSHLGALTSVRSEKEIAYYMKLLSTKTEEANNFLLPTDNRRYFGNSVPVENTAKDFGEFDFIIVGAGSSGSVILNRLAQIAEWNILMLEAGGEEDDFSDIPGTMFYTHLSDKNWGYNTTSQTTSCLGMNHNQCVYPRGRVIGGSGTINALMYVRGNKNDFDNWQELGNPGWSYDNLLPYFKKSEHYEIEDGDKQFHSTTGLWNVTYFTPPEPVTQYFLEANRELGFKYVDYNGEDQMGYSRLQMNLNRGKRASGGRTFIDPVRNFENIQVVTNALVTKILINENKTTYGVNFLKDGQLYKASVKNEVVISAGAVNTPQLLMLSGIGPAEHLKEYNISIVQDLPVGKHLKDHPVFVGLNFRTNYTYKEPHTIKLIRDYLEGKGLLTYCANTQGIKFINTVCPSGSVPDIEYIFIPPPSMSPLDAKNYNWRPEIAEMRAKTKNKNSDFLLLIVLLHPKSIGEITLKSMDPLDFVNINTNYFSDEKDEDVDTIYRAVLHALTMLNTNAFRQLNATLSFDMPFCNEHEKYSRDYWHCSIRHLSTTLYHTSGTAKMGPDPTNSVVNYELKVHGVEKLRVADCSIIPSSTSGHTNAPAFVIGEKLADFLKQRYQ